MKWHSRVVVLVMALMVGLATVACEKKGDAEKAGEAIDKAFSNAKEKLHEATE